MKNNEKQEKNEEQLKETNKMNETSKPTEEDLKKQIAIWSEKNKIWESTQQIETERIKNLEHENLDLQHQICV